MYDISTAVAPTLRVSLPRGRVVCARREARKDQVLGLPRNFFCNFTNIVQLKNVFIEFPRQDPEPARKEIIARSKGCRQNS